MAQPYSLDALLLCILLRGPNNGAGVFAALADLDPNLRPAQGGMYPALCRLEEERLTTVKLLPPPSGRGGRPRRFYALTAKGRRRAHELSRFFVALAGNELEAA